MDYILEEYGDNLLKYFRLLNSVGGSHAVEPYRFLITGFIDEILQSGMASFVTEDDYQAIDTLLNCMMGTCLMPFHEWQNTIAVGPKDLEAGQSNIINPNLATVLSWKKFFFIFDKTFV